MMCVSRS